jgi:CRISPR-associated endonuclease/helicase Cas3
MIEEFHSRMSHLWAKSPREFEKRGYPLFQHTLDVCWQAAQFYRLREANWPLNDEAQLPRILAYAALLHDFGKTHRDFQLALRPPHPRFQNRHEVLSLIFVAHLEVPEVERLWLCAAIASHHKGLFELFGGGAPFYPSQLFAESDSKARHLTDGIAESDRQILLDVMEHADDIFQMSGWFQIEPYAVVRELSNSPLQSLFDTAIEINKFFKVLSPIRSLSPSVPSERDWHRVVAAIHTRGLLINSDHLASFGRHEITGAVNKIEDVTNAYQEKIRVFNSFQEGAAKCATNAILVGPTGSGKTEAALLWAAAQSEFSGRNGRVVVLLPYQASMNAMQERLVCDLFPDSANDKLLWNHKVSLAHGRSIRKIYEALLGQKYSSAESAKLAQAQEELARLHVSPILISSAFSLIRLILASRGAEGLFEAFSGARIILDEVHAYEPAVTAMALASVRFLIDHLNAAVLVMTATMPQHLKEALITALPAATLLVGGDDVMKKPPRHQLHLMDIDALSDEAFQLICAAASEQSLLVVLNQVRRATALYERLRSKGFEALLLHSRFNYEDRVRIESQLAPTPGRILVATQAVEVSLNVSFAACFSELAPLESLLQRFGRCNRKGEAPVPAPVTVFCHLPSPFPYERQHLDAVLDALRHHCRGTGRALLQEKAMAHLIDLSYPQLMKENLTRAFQARFRDIREHIVEEFTPYGPRDAAQRDDLEQRWQALFDGEEVLPDVLVDQARQESTWLGRKRYMVPVPSHWLGRLNSKWDPDLLCYIAEADYDRETGLRVRVSS